jgi:hypothetical protein
MTTSKTPHDLLKRADEIRAEAQRTRDHGARAELLKLSEMWERLARTVRPRPLQHKH